MTHSAPYTTEHLNSQTDEELVELLDTLKDHASDAKQALRETDQQIGIVVRHQQERARRLSKLADKRLAGEVFKQSPLPGTIVTESERGDYVPRIYIGEIYTGGEYDPTKSGNYRTKLSHDGPSNTLMLWLARRVLSLQDELKVAQETLSERRLVATASEPEAIQETTKPSPAHQVQLDHYTTNWLVNLSGTVTLKVEE